MERGENLENGAEAAEPEPSPPSSSQRLSSTLKNLCSDSYDRVTLKPGAEADSQLDLEKNAINEAKDKDDEKNIDGTEKNDEKSPHENTHGTQKKNDEKKDQKKKDKEKKPEDHLFWRLLVFLGPLGLLAHS